MRILLGAALLLAAGAAPAAAESLGIRPLGGSQESARTVGVGNWAIEGGAWMPTFTSPPADLGEDDLKVLDNWQLTPAWPEIRGIYGLPDGNEAVGFVGPVVGGGYRKFFLRADAPWPNEYLQALIQLGGGFHLASRLPVGYIRIPAIFEAGAFTLHLAGGGYYLFNQQPMVDVDAGIELSPWENFQVGGMAKLRMDSKKITPFDGVWSLSGGARYRIGTRIVVQVDAYQDGGPPTFDTSKPDPRIEFPLSALRGSVGYYF
jgi:hypothetical protein